MKIKALTPIMYNHQTYQEGDIFDVLEDLTVERLVAAVLAEKIEEEQVTVAKKSKKTDPLPTETPVDPSPPSS